MQRKLGIHRAWILKVLILLGAMSLTRGIFLAYNNTAFQALTMGECLIAFLGGVRFDIVSVLICTSPFILLNILPLPGRTSRKYQWVSNMFFAVGVFLLLLFNGIDTGYYPYTHRRITAEFFKTSGAMGDILPLIPSYIANYWDLAIIFSALAALTIYAGIRIRPVQKEKPNLRYYGLQSFLFIIFGALTFLGIRGGVQSKPLKVISASMYAPANAMALVLNTPFTIITTADESGIERKDYMPAHEAHAYFSPQKTPAPTKPFRPLNVVVLILESFSSEYIGALNEDPDYPSFTPFLDSLIEKSFTAHHAYANGTASIQALPAITASLPTWMDETFVNSKYSSNHINTLPNLLKSKGYTSAFFHGGRNGTMSFDLFAKKAGFEKYYGLNEYPAPEDFDGYWGIADEPFLQFTADTLNEMQAPFVAAVFTLSSHDPYVIPENYKGKLPEGPHAIHQSIAYADQALRQFFEAASHMPWYEDTLFVITADHATFATHPDYQTRYHHAKIPIIFYHPGGQLTGAHKEYTQQTDILPSVLDYLHYTDPFVAFGESIFDPASKHFSMLYLNGMYALRHADHLGIFNGQIIKELYNLEKDPKMSENILSDSDTDLEPLAKSIIQNYNGRIIDNKLVSSFE